MSDFENDSSFSFVALVESSAGTVQADPDKRVIRSATYMVAETAQAGLIPVDEINFVVEGESSDQVDDGESSQPNDAVFHGISLRLLGYKAIDITHHDNGFQVWLTDETILLQPGDESEAFALKTVKSIRQMFADSLLTLKTT